MLTWGISYHLLFCNFANFANPLLCLATLPGAQADPADLLALLAGRRAGGAAAKLTAANLATALHRLAQAREREYNNYLKIKSKIKDFRKRKLKISIKANLFGNEIHRILKMSWDFSKFRQFSVKFAAKISKIIDFAKKQEDLRNNWQQI